MLGYRVNGGAMQWLDGSTSGVKTFPLLSALDKFTIFTKKSEPVGYTIPTGDVTLPTTAGLSQPVLTAGLKLVSDDANRWGMFNAARGVGVNTNPNSPHFGVAYVANGLNGVAAGGEQFLDRGVYALAADGTDAFGHGDFAPDPDASCSPRIWRDDAPVAIGDDDEVYVADGSNVSHGVMRSTVSCFSAGLFSCQASAWLPCRPKRTMVASAGSLSKARLTTGRWSFTPSIAI